MISLQALAANYGAKAVDRDGFEFEPYELAVSVERAIRRHLGEKIRFVVAFGDDVPNLHKGEVRAAHHAIRMAELDLAQVVALRKAEAA